MKWNAEWFSIFKWHTNKTIIYIWSKWHPGNPGGILAINLKSETRGGFFKNTKTPDFRFSRLVWYSKWLKCSTTSLFHWDSQRQTDILTPQRCSRGPVWRGVNVRVFHCFTCGGWRCSSCRSSCQRCWGRWGGVPSRLPPAAAGCCRTSLRTICLAGPSPTPASDAASPLSSEQDEQVNVRANCLSLVMNKLQLLKQGTFKPTTSNLHTAAKCCVPVLQALSGCLFSQPWQSRATSRCCCDTPNRAEPGSGPSSPHCSFLPKDGEFYRVNYWTGNKQQLIYTSSSFKTTLSFICSHVSGHLRQQKPTYTLF